MDHTCDNIIKLTLIYLSNSFFNSFMKTKNEKRTAFRFPFFYENEKRTKPLKIQSKNLLSMKMVVNYLKFVFRVEVKTESKYRILNFVFQFIRNTKWHFGLTDCLTFPLQPLAQHVPPPPFLLSLKPWWILIYVNIFLFFFFFSWIL